MPDVSSFRLLTRFQGAFHGSRPDVSVSRPGCVVNVNCILIHTYCDFRIRYAGMSLPFLLNSVS